MFGGPGGSARCRPRGSPPAGWGSLPCCPALGAAPHPPDPPSVFLVFQSLGPGPCLLLQQHFLNRAPFSQIRQESLNWCQEVHAANNGVKHRLLFLLFQLWELGWILQHAPQLQDSLFLPLFRGSCCWSFQQGLPLSCQVFPLHRVPAAVKEINELFYSWNKLCTQRQERFVSPTAQLRWDSAKCPCSWQGVGSR